MSERRDLLEELLSAGMVPSTSFPATSRYAGVGVTVHDPGGEQPPIPHLRRRPCPPVERFATLYAISIVEGDRRDLIAHRHLGDAELWWRIADANGVLDPRSLTATPGAAVRVTLAEGAPEPPDA